MKKVYFQFEGDDGYAEIGVAHSARDAEVAVRHFVCNLDGTHEVRVETTKAGYFAIVVEL